MAFLINRSRCLILLIGGFVAMCMPQAARAALEISLQEDGGPVTVIGPAADFTDLSFNGTFGDFKIVFLGASSDNGTVGGMPADLMTSTTKVTNTSGATHTLVIGVTQTDYTLPGGPTSTDVMTSHIGGSVNTGGVGQTLTFQSYANNSNGLFDTVGATTTGPQSPDVTGSSSSSFDSEPDPSVLFPRSSAMYSVTTYNTITLVSGGTLNYASTTTITGTPAPAGFILAFAACPALGLGAWLKRRARKALA